MLERIGGCCLLFFFSSRRRHTRYWRDWSSDVCSSDLQSVEKFMAAAEKVKPDIIGMSALLTTTMTYMKTVIDGFHAAGRDDIKFAIGGAPISQMFADEIGADGYGQ